MSGDLKIITGSGQHSLGGKSLLRPRIERLLTDEFGLRYEHEWRTECTARDCTTHVNAGCLVVQMQELFRFLAETRPFETYVVTLPGASQGRASPGTL